MASLRPISPQPLPSLSKKPISLKPNKPTHFPLRHRAFSTSPLREVDVLPVLSPDITDQLNGAMPMSLEGGDGGKRMEIGGFEGRLSLEGAGAVTSTNNNGGGGDGNGGGGQDVDKLVDRGINAAIVLAAGTFAITKLLTIDHDYWHGWTLFEILRYAPQHNWSAYEEILKTNPVFAKMIISGVVYSLGDWIAQCLRGNLYLTLIAPVCSDLVLPGSCYMVLSLIIIMNFVRLYSHSKTGGWFLSKWPLIKLYGLLSGTASISQFWDSYGWSHLLVSSKS